MTELRDDRMGGMALIAGAIGLLLTMSIHPTGQDLLAPGQFAWMAFLGVAAHTLAIATMPVSFLGALSLSRRLASPDRLSIAALVVFACSLFAGMIAGVMSGFVAGGVAREMLHATGAAAEEWRLLFDFTGRLNQAFSLVLVAASSVAMMLWSVTMVRSRGLMRGVGIYGLALAPIILLALFSGQLRLDVFGFGLVVLGQSIWFILTGLSMMSLKMRAASLVPFAACVAVLIAALLTHLAHVRHGHPKLTADAIKLGATEIAIPMERFQNRPTVRMMINGSGPYRLIVDTGAGASVIGPEIADQLKLSSEGKIRLGSPLHPEGTVARIVRSQHLTAEGLDITGLRWVANPLPQFSGNEPDVPQGVLSALAFDGYLLTVDGPKNLLRLSKGALPAANGKDIFEYDSHLPKVSVNVAGRILNLTLDLGDRRALTLPDSYALELPLDALPVDSEPVRMSGGSAKARRATLNEKATLGSFSFDRPEITFVEGLPFGDIGAALLGRFAITVDAENHRVRIAGPEKQEPPR